MFLKNSEEKTPNQKSDISILIFQSKALSRQSILIQEVVSENDFLLVSLLRENAWKRLDTRPSIVRRRKRALVESKLK